MPGCLHPITINKPNKLAGLRVIEGFDYIPYHHYGEFFEKVPRYNRLYGFNRTKMTVSCGKCIMCLKKRQNSLAVRCMREAAKRGSMCFLTLTYSNEYLPLRVSLETIDKSTGECTTGMSFPLVRPADASHVGSPEFVEWIRGELELIPKSPHARVVSKTIVEDDDYLYRYLITPSLNRRDVRLWLKRSRVRYKREFGVSLPDFSYVVCGEMGPRTARPHYHLCFFGLTFEQVSYLRNQWDFGFTNLKSVNAVNPDGSNGYEIASKYIGKYMAKGMFECDCVKDGLAEKPRLMMSKHLGTELSDSLISYYRCYDIFGKYDIDSLCLESIGIKLTSVQLRSLFKEVRKRSFMEFGFKRYCIPRNILIKI